MKFGKTFPNHQVPEWSEYYVDYKHLKKLIKQIVSAQKDIIKSFIRENSEKLANNEITMIDNIDTLNSDKIRKLLAQFFFILDKDLEKIDTFYTDHFSEYDRRMRRLLSSVQVTSLYTLPSSFSIDNNEKGNNSSVSIGGINNTNNRNSRQLASRYMQKTMPTNNNSVTAIKRLEEDNLEDWDELFNILIDLRTYFRNLKWYGELNKRAFAKILKKLDKKCGTNQQQIYLNARVYPLDFCNDDEVFVNLNTINELLDIVSPKLHKQNRSSNSSQNSTDVENKEFVKEYEKEYDVLMELIKKDDSAGLMNELIYTYRSVVLIPTRILINLLNKCALNQSYKCIDDILEVIPTLGDPNDINKRNFFHHHIIALGKNYNTQNKPITKINNGNTEEITNGLNTLLLSSIDSGIEPAFPPDNKLIGAFGPDGINSNDSPSSLKHILSKLPAHLRPSLLKKDNYKRTPLHYSAQYGLVEVTRIIIEKLKDWDVWNPSIPIDDIEIWGDSEKLTPLHLAVIGTHPVTLKVLCKFMNPDVRLNSPKLLHLATKLNSPELIDSLLSLKVKGFYLDYQDVETKETALYVAAKLNLLNAAKCLIKHGANTEIRERLFGWTPIFASCTEGYKEMCELLVNEGHCEIEIFDESGWTPMEHAALRGHLEITDLLEVKDPIVTNPVITNEVREKSMSPLSGIGNGITTAAFLIENNFSNQVKSSNNDIASTSTSTSSFYQNSSTPDVSSSVTKISTPANLRKQKPTKKYLMEETSVVNNTSNHVNINIEQPHPHVMKALDTETVDTGNNIVIDEESNAHINPVTLNAIKSFGHDYLKPTESFISITLGTNDTRTQTPAVSLNKVPISRISSTGLDTALSLCISCRDSLKETPVVLDLPLDETVNAVNFKIPYKENMNHVIYFDLVPTYGYQQQEEYNDYYMGDSHNMNGTSTLNNDNYYNIECDHVMNKFNNEHDDGFCNINNNSIDSRPFMYRNGSSHSISSVHSNASSGNGHRYPYSINNINYQLKKKNKQKLNRNHNKRPFNSTMLGRAVALLDTARTKVGDHRRSLQDTITVPIISSETMEVLGTIQFEFILIKPFITGNLGFIDSNKKWSTNDTYWKSLVSTRVIGHRGLGKNNASRKSLQLGENTVESFIAAASLGASYVEFDVQLTKDHVPVVYHDFLVAESGVDIPMHELTLEQFLDLNNMDGTDKHTVKSSLDEHKYMPALATNAVNNASSNNGNNNNSSSSSISSINNNNNNHKNMENNSSASRRRRSVDDSDIHKKTNHQIEQLAGFRERRMRLTKTYKEKNFKGNFRGSSIASSFVTLKELFHKIPSNVGFNIECKYPMSDEADKEEIGQIAVDMNFWCDTVLSVIYENIGKDRDVIFSSFSPDICLMLSLKQPNFPILYLTEAGTTIMADARAVSLQSAIRFARTWNLLGIVSAAKPIVKAPRLAHVVKSSGLVCVTYGVENNDPATARKEMDAGVDAVIVDSVLAVRKELTRNNK